MLMKVEFCILILLLISIYINCTIIWKPDVIQFQSNLTHSASSRKWVYNLLIKSGGPIYPVKTGHISFRFNISINHLPIINAVTPCLRLTAPFEDYTAMIASTLAGRYPLSVGDDLTMNKLFSIHVEKYYENYVNSTTRGLTGFAMELTAKKMNITHLSVDYLTSSCEKIRTVGYWHDAHRWSANRVPTSADTVIIPLGAGVIKLTEDTTISSLQMLDGLLVLQSSNCPPGWTTDNRYALSQKCYLLVETPLAMTDAERYCQSAFGSLGAGSIGAHLMHIGDRQENNLLYRLCRGTPTSLAAQLGCWIGLQNDGTSEEFKWLSVPSLGRNSNAGSWFTDFRRFEPDNHTVSDGFESPGGERCVASVPWQQDPMLLEQGGWNDDACHTLRPFVCQVFSPIQRSTLTITNSTYCSGNSVMEGGSVITGSGQSILQQLMLTKSLQLTLSRSHLNTHNHVEIHQLYLQDNVLVKADTSIVLFNQSFIGERSDASSKKQCMTCGTAQSTLICTSNSTLSDGSKTGVIANINASIVLQGVLLLSSGSHVLVMQGGDVSRGSATLSTTTSALMFASNAVKFVSFDSYELQLTHTRPVIGEYYGHTNYSLEDSNAFFSTSSSATLATHYTKGVYRITIQGKISSSSTSSTTQTTQCIPYNATASQLTSMLNTLSLISIRGGVTVRTLSGDQNNVNYAYGYRYRIELDGILTSQYSLGPVVVSIGCYGTAKCGCADTVVTKTTTPGGVQACPNNVNTSLVRSDGCVMAPQIIIRTLTSCGYLQTGLSGASSSGGQIVLLSGYHRLPPVVVGTVIIQAQATGVVATDAMVWTGVQVSGQGVLVAAGRGWAGYDSASLLFAPAWTDRRGLYSALSTTPSFVFTVQQAVLSERGSYYTTGPRANTTFTSLHFAGGEVGGLSTLYIGQKLVWDTNALKSVSYGMVLQVVAKAVATWHDGNITLGNGANIIIEGILNITNTASLSTTQYPIALGTKEWMADSVFPEVPGRNWQSYYTSTLVSELVSGWYENPLCGSICQATKVLTIRGSGALHTGPYSSTVFLAMVNITGTTTFEVGTYGKVVMISGGIFGNDVVVDLRANTVLELSGGQLRMEAGCTIQGAGELLVSSGVHDLAYSINAHITITGTGVLVWPMTHGNGQTITFNGGLLLEAQGALRILAYSTIILVYQSVTITDSAMISFPLLGIAAQASPFDESDAPDTSPRGHFQAYGIMNWLGGTLQGKADFTAHHILYLDGSTKYINSLAKLVNAGHCEWGSGDLIASDEGDFLNLGSLQMKESVGQFASSAFYTGTEMPVDNGGDVFALNYNSWDEDNGALSYAQYIKLRTQFVSKVPAGWTP